jgi:hypothetical protein
MNSNTNKRKSRRNVVNNEQPVDYNEQIKNTQTFLDDLISSNQDSYDNLKLIKNLTGVYESKMIAIFFSVFSVNKSIFN